MTLSGGMKRRVLIAKALSHEPTILFLDEPTAGVDVELRRDMWQMVRGLRDSGVTIILTTHYIEEAEEMADRIGVISKGELIVVEDKTRLMRKLGKRQLTLQLQQPLAQLSPGLAEYPLELSADGHALVFTFDAHSRETRHSRAAEAPRRAEHRGQGSALERELARRHLRRLVSARMNVHAIRAIYRFEMAQDVPHADAEHRLPGAVDLAVLRGLRCRDRPAHGSDRSRQLRRVHRAGPDHAVDSQRERLERLVRHLPAQVVGHDLRAAVGAGLIRRGAARLRRRGGHQVRHARHPDPGDGACVRPLPDCAPTVDGRLPGADGGDLQSALASSSVCGRTASSSCRSCR